MTLFNIYFENIVCLSQKQRLDRRFLFSQNADFKFQWFDAIDDDNPHHSFCTSMKSIFQKYKYSSSLLVFEDDATFMHLEMLDEIMKGLPRDYDIIYFGANLKPHPDAELPIKVTDKLYKVSNAYTSHAIGYNHNAVKYIANNYDTDIMFDVWMDQVVLKELNAYVCLPFLSYQRPTRSDLWGRNVDYTDTFNASEELLKSIK